MATRGEIKVIGRDGGETFVVLDYDARKETAFRAAMKANDWVLTKAKAPPTAKEIAQRIRTAYKPGATVSEKSPFDGVEDPFREYAAVVTLVREPPLDPSGNSNRDARWRLTFEDLPVYGDSPTERQA